MTYMKKNLHFCNLKKTHYGPTDGRTDGPTDGRTDGQTLLWRCEDASKNWITQVGGSRISISMGPQPKKERTKVAKNSRKNKKKFLMTLENPLS